MKKRFLEGYKIEYWLNGKWELYQETSDIAIADIIFESCKERNGHTSARIREFSSIIIKED